MKKNLPITGKEVQLSEESTIISTTDMKGQITYVNKEFINISGFSEDELVGQSHNVGRHPDMPPEAFKDLWETIQAGDPWRGIVKNRCKNGDHYWVDAFVTPVADSHGQVTGYQSVRSRPSREQIAGAEALYDRLNRKQISTIPTRFKIQDISMMKRITLAVLLSIIISLAAVILWAAEVIPPGLSALMVLGSSSILLITLGLIYKTLILPIHQIIAIAKGIAGGNLHQHIVADSNDEVGQLLMSLKLMQARLQTVIGRLTEVSNDVTQDAVMLSSSSTRTLDMMNQQQVETELVATAMNEMSATVSEVARNTEEAALAAVEASDNATNGKTVVNKVRDSISQLVTEVENTADAITDLEDKSDDIQSIMGVIHGIADQTNLLALNAAIEAARAGEQGRGFAVVADEVRTLAGRTQDATEEINKVIEELRGGINRAVHVMNKGRKQAYDAIEQSDEAESSLGAITDSVTKINDMNAQIATAATEQSAVAEEMNRNVVNISQMTVATVDTAHYNSDAGKRLAELSTEMQRQFDSFDLGDDKSSNHNRTNAEPLDDDGLF